MLDTRIRESVVRIHALDVAADLFGRWHAQKRAQLPPPHEVAEQISALSEPDRQELDRRLLALSDIEVMARIVEFPARLRSIRPLHAEDRRFVAEYRCHLVDAADHLRLGEYADACEQLRKARDGIDWLINKRSRAHDYRWRSIEATVRDELVGFIAELDLALQGLSAAVRWAS